MSPVNRIKPLRTTTKDDGSALLEFTLVLGILIPIGLGVSMLGKLADLQHTTEQASRYSTWEATVYSRAHLAAQPASIVESRFFKTPDALISSKAEKNNAEQAEHPLWGESASQPGGLRQWANVSRRADKQVASRYTFDTGKAKASLFTGKMVAAAGKPLSGFKDNSWGLVADGLLRSGVEVAVEPTALFTGSTAPCGTSASSDSSDNAHSICVRGSGAILADGWAANGDAQAISRVRSLVPASTLQVIGEGVGALLGSVVFPELDPLDKAFGHVDMGVLPEYAKP